MTTITSHTLGCGLTVAIESNPTVGSAGLTWLVPGGVARDPEGRVGVSAVIEELLLRGAGSRDSREDADAFDRLGVARGTGTETMHTAVSATMLAARVPDVLPLIADMVLRPRFDADAFEPARDLCVQAVEGLIDDPQERVMHLLKRLHAPAPINRSHLGELDDLEAMTPDEPRAHWARCARPHGSILGLAGNIDADAVLAQLDALLSGWTGEEARVFVGQAPERSIHHVEASSNQVHIAIAYDGPTEADDNCWLERAATAVLSGGMSGRLFTEVREKRSLCYAVYASYRAGRDEGRTIAYVGTTPERAQESLDVLTAELVRVRSGGVTRQEFDRAIVGMKSKLVMSGESTSARASAIARDVYRVGVPRTLDELAGRIDAMSLDQVNHYLARTPIRAMTTVVLGPSALREPGALG